MGIHIVVVVVGVRGRSVTFGGVSVTNHDESWMTYPTQPDGFAISMEGMGIVGV